ncbi:MAG: FadR family transcriptional regulator [Fusobacteriaceae bacterium]|jgi:DNA-binding FadR family transcriptional regulator|nr:FadR family transcriptional regulator [Fusobacteriaceae bacterium]
MKEEFIPISQVIAGRLTDMIFREKKYQLNEKLPNENELSALLGVSRASLREAIKILAVEGILTIKRGSGTFVTSSPKKKDDLFGLKYLEDKKKLITHWFEFRIILEPSSVKLAVLNGTKEEKKAILDSAKRLEHLIREQKTIIAEDQAFHRAVAAATHNDVIKLTIPSLLAAVKDTILTSTHIGGSKRSYENALIYHRLIADFIAAGDAEGAELAMRYHLTRGLNDMLAEK